MPAGPARPGRSCRGACLSRRLVREVGLSRIAFHAVVDWALSIAPSMRDPEAMATALVEELRRRHILLPSFAVLELMVRTVQRRTGAVVHRALTHGLSEQTRVALEQLVDAGPETTASRLAWLRTASRSPAARNLARAAWTSRLCDQCALVRVARDHNANHGAIYAWQYDYQRHRSLALRPRSTTRLRPKAT
jgi:Domain of unknown function (DUF4158)